MTGNPTETQQMVADIPREEDVLQEPEEPTEEEPEEEQDKEDSQEGALTHHPRVEYRRDPYSISLRVCKGLPFCR